ncbi:DUF4114 domain-containing protein [Oscillatoria sp. HE19RPO]|uniref:DUF4114 domain-containing protein n=1 Tax=Oscillatoria sp. HE19RPO TaxID=2954806 RepID=UPI0020C30C15|nr:DUF4114 domain-containing protein [Oscillatoria sp. HE19RPO]
MNKLLAISVTAATLTSLLGMAKPASAFTFGTDGISFNTTQQVRFNFTSSNNAFQSTVKVFEVLSNGQLQEATNGVLSEELKASDNGPRNGFQSTLGNAVQQVNDTFTFLAGRVYTLGLVSTFTRTEAGTLRTIDAGTVYSTSRFNILNGLMGKQRAVFGSTGAPEGQAFNAASSFQSANPFNGPVAIGFEDIKWGNGDNDFNDFVVTAQAVPEPLTMGGLALGAAGLAAARRSRKRHTTEA